MNSIINNLWYNKKSYITAKADLLSQGFNPDATNIGDTCIVIFCYNLYNKLLSFLPNSPRNFDWPYNTTQLRLCVIPGGKEIAFHFPAYGAMKIASSLEQLSACGIKKVFGIGLGGTPQEHLNIGDIILLEGAVKGDGVSQYYSPVEFPALPDFELTSKIKNRLDSCCENYHMGLSFGTDCLYRETEELTCLLRELGVILIDLESSAFFTVSHRLGLKCCWAGIVSDRLVNSRHEGNAHSEFIIDQLLHLSSHIIQVAESA